MTHDDLYDEMRTEFRAERSARSFRIAALSCSDGFCGAVDCYRCRGEDALLEIFTEEGE